MKYLKPSLLGLLLILFWFISACGENGEFLDFSVEDDIALGQQIASAIEANPDQFPLIPRTGNELAYTYIEAMLTEIIASDTIAYRDEFPWRITLIDDDQVLSAFATPGGQLYVYTGLIFLLAGQDDLAGVISHEVAHTDQRHYSKQLQRDYGVSSLLSVASGQNPEDLAQIINQIIESGTIVRLGRSAEAEADEFSVRYLSSSRYACNSAATFFEQLVARNDAGVVVDYLKSHPQPEDRISNTNSLAMTIGCPVVGSDPTREEWEDFRSLLR